MLSRIVRHAARVMLLKVSSGGKPGRQVTLDSLPFRAETVIKGFLNDYFPLPAARRKRKSPIAESRATLRNSD